jgi:hypothetical protein
MPGLALGDVAALRWLYLPAKPSHVSVDVDGIVYPLHHPTVYDHQMRGQSFLLGDSLSHCATVGSGALPGGWGARPPGLNI